MLSEKVFRLKREILAIETSEDSNERRALYVPAGATVGVVSGPRTDDKRLVDIYWSGRRLVLFAEDLINRAEELEAPTARKSSAG